jgi:glycosyltransferase involved in cell wall biosynthesis
MKITIVTGAFFPVPPIMGGAVEKVWFALAQEFARRGHEVVQISRAHPTLPINESASGVTHIRVKGFDQPHSIVWLKFLDLIYSWRVRRVLPAADILVTNTFWLPILERTRNHGLLYVHVARFPKGQMRFYAHAARLQAVSRAVADGIRVQAPQLRPKIRVLPNPVLFQVENLSPSDRSHTILFVGRIHPEKGIELLLRAFASLPREMGVHWKLKVVGPHQIRFGGGGDNFLQEMQEIGAPAEWVGPVFDETELGAYYRASAIFVYPSLAESGEAFGLAPIEAMSNGCVPLVSDLPVFREYIDDGTNGFVFERRGKEKALRERLLDLLRLGEIERAKIADAARLKATEFALELVAQRYLEDFQSLLAKISIPHRHG